MKRTPLNRRTPLKRRLPMRKANPRRRRESFERNYGERGDYIRAMPCLLAQFGTCMGPIQAAHVKARGMGGRGGDRHSLVPLCGVHHLKMGVMGVKSFAARFRVDLGAIASAIDEQLTAGGVP